jgi:hypothetical protein
VDEIDETQIQQKFILNIWSLTISMIIAHVIETATRMSEVLK